MTEGPYKLPKGWRWVRLGDICDIYQPKTITIHEIKLNPGPYPVFGANGIIGYYTKYNHEESQVLVTCRGSTCGTVNLSHPYSWITGNAMVVKPVIAGLEKIYLFWALRASNLKNIVGGSAQPQITKSILSDVTIPLAPINEQLHILKYIDELISRIREAKRLRQEAQQEAERLWQSVLADTFPKPGTKLPNGWQWVKLEDIAQVFSGSSAPQDEDYFTDGKYPFVRVSDLSSSVDGYITKTRDAINDKAIKELKLIKAAAGAIVFPKSGAAILTNARAILAIDAYIVSHLAALSPDRSKADKNWLYYYLSTVDMGQYSDNPSYPSLKLSRIKNIEIPLPNLIKQREIVAYLKCIHEKVQSMREAQAQTEAELQRLEQAILDKAFRGEL